MNTVLSKLSISWKLLLLAMPFIVGTLITFAVLYNGLERVKVNGPLYREIANTKDLLTDVLPPPAYLIESYLTALELAQDHDRATVEKLLARSKELETAYDERHKFWLKELSDGPIKEALTVTSYLPAKAFFATWHNDFLPAVQAGNLAKAHQIATTSLIQQYADHRRGIDQVVAAAIPWQKQQEEEVKGVVQTTILHAALWMAAILAGAMFAGWTIARSITFPLRRMVDIFGNFTHGDLTSRVPVEGRDEVAMLSMSFNECTENLQALVGKVAHVTDKLASASVELSATAEEISKGTDTLTSRASQTAAAVEEMNATVSQVAQNSGKAATLAQETVKTAKDGGSVVSDTISGMQQLSDAVSSSATIIAELGKSSDQIGEIVRVIEDIADQTNLLALNAAIEAARAGEQGRGFAVVADEVRKLAERTTKATKEIGDMIRQIQQDTRGAVESMQQGTQTVTKGVDLVNKTGEALTRIVEMVSESADMIRQIAVASEEQSVATQQIATDIENVAKVTKESASGATESAKASHDLSQLATELQGIVGSFKL
ncbi:MAG: methyl-accepting chemotaxis protein [Nitrospira sp.]|nr:methyl-accepting chemotaxis protein [Nitrospira sp.]